jgi:hypothetical protein
LSYEYDSYLERHRENVRKGYSWMQEHIPEVLKDGVADWEVNFNHDSSKNSTDEYEAYDAYFYGNNRSFAVVNAFRRAWLLHIHRNPHHWQHWVLINDEPNEGEIVLEMPYEYIIEMICDWWSFSWSKNNPAEIFDWYEKHSKYMRLADTTRKTVEDILNKIYENLPQNEFAHHGIKGQKWGVRNGPPYPLDESISNAIITCKGRQDGRTYTISKDKFTQYALNPDKDPNKARAFELALGYNKDNCDKLIEDIMTEVDKSKMRDRGNAGYGMRREQVMRLSGPNGKEANVATGWIEESDSVRLTSVYITEKEESK